MKYTPVIGLEVHIELKTDAKMFCGCSTNIFGQEPNSRACPVCLGLPGALPVPNRKAIECCIMIGSALNCEIPLISKFDRKNYFYPDLSKGYQISQYDQPFAQNGYIKLTNKKIGIRRAHMEEDTGKLAHESIKGEDISLIDFNRSGIPLVEIVTEPDFESALEVKEYLQKLQQIVRYLGVSNADMEKGEMRLEPNISLRKTGTKNLPDYKVEVKNINSFKFVEKAIAYELVRQKKILETGNKPLQETRGWDEDKQATFSQRTKEEAQDYRYFPEPDIPPFIWTKEQIQKIKSQVPELADKKRERLQNEYKITEYDAEILTRDLYTVNYFEESAKLLKRQNLKDIDFKTLCNFMINKKVDIDKVSPETFIKQVENDKKVDSIDQGELKVLIEQVIKDNSKAVEDYRGGKKASIMFLLGQVMRKIGKKVDANEIRKAIEKSLEE